MWRTPICAASNPRSSREFLRSLLAKIAGRFHFSRNSGKCQKLSILNWVLRRLFRQSYVWDLRQFQTLGLPLSLARPRQNYHNCGSIPGVLTTELCANSSSHDRYRREGANLGWTIGATLLLPQENASDQLRYIAGPSPQPIA